MKKYLVSVAIVIYAFCSLQACSTQRDSRVTSTGRNFPHDADKNAEKEEKAKDGKKPKQNNKKPDDSN
ncbi:hypothetical protein MUY27_18095 [Mucilaginibacter sp. RS28]|uniref:Lipoprotein n=1 Tax=Mucilaginibacter straminoryzae TaxID=2932774 RepID=A0A9X2BBB8_9SPHI|nr:hypothetical protein [Mucilaginibacter straminoryzae]MCJ8211635.1 hypothetical protein [Mucilaginibacter straminoryzae]